MSVSDREEEARRAYQVLTVAMAAGADDFDHPGYETLEALVDGRLGGPDREAVESHMAVCRTCKDDVADLSAIQAEIASGTAAATPRWRLRMSVVGVGAGVAAALLLAVSLANRGPSEPAASAPALVAREPAASARPGPAREPNGMTLEEQQVVARAIAEGRVELSSNVRALAGGVGTLLGTAAEPDRFGPVMPKGTAVASARPRFAWRPTDGATAYTVAVFDEGFNQVAGERVSGTTWTPEEDLPRGAIYAWQVTAHVPSGDLIAPTPPQPEARFRIVDAPTAAEVAGQQSRLAGQPLALGILLARAGLVPEAVREIERAASGPDASPQARRILSTITPTK